MEIRYPGFGSIEIDGRRFDHDVIVEAGEIRPRKKKPSRVHRSAYGHTPLSLAEDIPWGASRLVVGTGADGRLPIMPDVWERAEQLGLELVAMPTSEAVDLLKPVDPKEVFAVLHVTC